MQLYVTRNGQRVGPLPAEQVTTLLTTGELKPTELFWHEGRAGWSPLTEWSGLPRELAPTETMAADESGPQVRPWVRYFARTLDIYLFDIGTGFVLGIVAPAALEGASIYLQGIILLGLWCFVEPLFLCSFEATPGKALLRVRVTHADGTPLRYTEALARSFHVWMRGMGAGIPLLSLITLAHSYEQLNKQHVTAWDKSAGYKVSHRDISIWRILLGLLLGALVVALMVYGQLQKAGAP